MGPTHSRVNALEAGICMTGIAGGVVTSCSDWVTPPIQVFRKVPNTDCITLLFSSIFSLGPSVVNIAREMTPRCKDLASARLPAGFTKKILMSNS